MRKAAAFGPAFAMLVGTAGLAGAMRKADYQKSRRTEKSVRQLYEDCVKQMTGK